MCRGMYFVLFAAHVAFVWAAEKECSNQQAAEASDKGSALLQVGSGHGDSVKKVFAQLEGDKLGDSPSDVQPEGCDWVNISMITKKLDENFQLNTQDDFDACVQKGIDAGCRFVFVSRQGTCGCSDTRPCDSLKLFSPGAEHGTLWTQPCPKDVLAVVVDGVSDSAKGRWFFFQPWKMACLLGKHSPFNTEKEYAKQRDTVDVIQMRNGLEEWSGKVNVTQFNMGGSGPLYGERAEGPNWFTAGPRIDYFSDDYVNHRVDNKFGHGPYKYGGIGNRAEGDADGQFQTGDLIFLKKE